MEWLTRVTALLLQVAIQNWFAHDPFFSKFMASGDETIDLNNQSNLRIPREYGRVGNPRVTSMGTPELKATKTPGRVETSVNIREMPFPLAMPGGELRRLNKQNVQATLKSILTRAIYQHKTALMRRLWSGSTVTGDEDYTIFPTLNPYADDCTAPGLEKSLIAFDAPEDQTGTYLGWTRTYSEADNHLSSWFSQGQDWSTPRELIDAIRTVVEECRLAHMSEQENPIAMGILSMATFIELNRAFDAYSDAGFPTVMYTAEDMQKGRFAAPTRLVNGIPFSPSKWVFDDDFDVDSPMTVLSLDELKWLKNGQYTIGEDGQGITPWRNFLETCGQDFLVAWWFISGGWYHSNPRSCGAVWKRAA